MLSPLFAARVWHAHSEVKLEFHDTLGMLLCGIRWSGEIPSTNSLDKKVIGQDSIRVRNQLSSIRSLIAAL